MLLATAPFRHRKMVVAAVGWRRREEMMKIRNFVFPITRLLFDRLPLLFG
ncbi:hypothetical protein Lalb_Chr20g0116541 [Lupinus albus]|uniref:Uncharacterized protein n=1 Tax=Lupinus albus TaxID=3870 RepID=A0A6A4NU58_LUPAL|nr:hypothetical protein Lalb_Chr20g0116541 [Lupinus albus]